MSDYSSEDIVKYSISKDGARVKEAIHGVLADKVMKHLEAKKRKLLNLCLILFLIQSKRHNLPQWRQRIPRQRHETV